MSRFCPSGNLRVHFTDDGPRGAPALVLAHGLGTDLRLWDALLPLLPAGLRVIRYDLRGHGQSECPVPPYAMGALIRDAEGLLDHLGLRDCVFAGLGLGGMIAQGLAVKRLDLVRALVLASTAAKWGLPGRWQAHARSVQDHGMTGVADEVMARWFSPQAIARGAAAPWRARLIAQHPDGYAGACAAIAGTDFFTPTSGLRLPVLGLAGVEDRATPPDLLRETVMLVPGARFQLIRRAGHLVCAEQPGDFAVHLGGFLQAVGQV